MLRPYQAESIASLRTAIAKGSRRPVLQLPTGGGKTHIASEIVRGAIEKGKYVLFLAPRRELIYQASARFSARGIHHGLVMAGEPRDIWARVQIASMDTLYQRGIRAETQFMPRADVVIVDEAHLSLAPTRKAILAQYPEAVIIGLTATPARGDGRGLGEVYDSLVLSWDVRRLTEAGYLVPVRYFAPSKPDLKGLKTGRDGDYVVTGEHGIGARMDRPKLVGDIVDNWRRIAPDKKTVVFCSTISHSLHVCEEFTRAGVRAEHLDGKTESSERQAILSRVESGETQVLCNVFVASYGLDIPTLECAVLARPTRNITLYLQTVGRILRPSEGKSEAIVIDHSGAVDEHGFVDDYVPWSLDDKGTVKERKKAAQEASQQPREITCGKCGVVFRARRTCPGCGNEMVAQGKAIPVHQAELKEVARPDKASWLAQLKGYQEAKKKTERWLVAKYREKFGEYPPDAIRGVQPLPVSAEVSRWITSRNIAWARRR